MRYPVKTVLSAIGGAQHDLGAEDEAVGRTDDGPNSRVTGVLPRSGGGAGPRAQSGIGAPDISTVN